MRLKVLIQNAAILEIETEVASTLESVSSLTLRSVSEYTLLHFYIYILKSNIIIYHIYNM